METSYLIQDLAAVVVGASVVSIIFSMLKWPSILGYLLTGLLIGPHLSPDIFIHDKISVQEISELGVIFLMFCIGLEFDLKKLQQTLFPCLLAMFLQVILAFFIGALMARFLGWTALEGTFLGAVCAISSSMVAIPILRQKNALRKSFAQFTIGIAILEDIFAVVLLVIFSNAGQSRFNWHQCLSLIFWMTSFIASMLVLGRLFAQRFLKILTNIHSEEIIHVCVVGLILLLSELFHSYSNALGAFLAGAIFSSTHITSRLETMIAPIRDVFTAIFFVSIGMMIEPKLLWDQKFTILCLSIIVVAGQMISVWLGFFLSGQTSSNAFRAALPKSQIGEFSFVIAALAQKLGVADGNLMAITVGTALFTIIFVNILSAKEDDCLQFFDRMIPCSLKSWSSLYQNVLVSIQNHLSKSHFLVIVKKPLLKISIHFFIINVIVWCNAWLCNFIGHYAWPYLIWIQRGLSMLALLLALPFMSSMVRNLNLIILNICKRTLKGVFQRMSHHPAMYQIFQLLVITIATLVFAWLFLTASAQFIPIYMPILMLVVVGIIIGFAFWRQFREINSQIEWMFLESFKSELESNNEKRKRAMAKIITQKHPWDAQISTVVLNANSHVIGQHLSDTHLRNQTGATLLGISRNGFLSYEVNPSMIFFPEDNLVLLGSESQLQAAATFLNQPQTCEEEFAHNGFDLEQIVITSGHPWANETMESVDVRKRFGVNVIGIQRNEQRIDTLQANDIFKIGDIVWVVGHPDYIRPLKLS
ncbi:MAG: cation:proton antiporter [Puniceicoccales bacterium]|jgi:CPA2 family monovalent cation:H+ antiporter-2|nr:cation:proton antiporter [Puniceicoccales bacterium]